MRPRDHLKTEASSSYDDQPCIHFTDCIPSTSMLTHFSFCKPLYSLIRRCFAPAGDAILLGGFCLVLERYGTFFGQKRKLGSDERGKK